MVLTKNFSNNLDEKIQELYNTGTKYINVGTNNTVVGEDITDLIWKSEEQNIAFSIKEVNPQHAFFSFYIDAAQMNDLPYNIREGNNYTDVNIDNTKGVKIKIKTMSESFTIKKLVIPIKKISGNSDTINISVIKETGETVSTTSIDVASNSYSEFTVDINESTIPSVQYYILLKPLDGTFAIQTISEDLGDLYEDDSPLGSAIVSKIYIDRICEVGFYNSLDNTTELWVREISNPPLRKDTNTALQIDWEFYWEIDG